jgi:hypothetical protein
MNRFSMILFGILVPFKKASCPAICNVHISKLYVSRMFDFTTSGRGARYSKKEVILSAKHHEEVSVQP